MDMELEKFKTIKSKITQYYEMRKDVNRDGIEKIDDLEALNNTKIEELNNLKRQIDELMKQAGLEFNPETCEVEQIGNIEIEDDIKDNLIEIDGKFKDVADDYFETSRQYVGKQVNVEPMNEQNVDNENPADEEEPKQGQDDQEIVPLKVMISEKKSIMYDRDVETKKILKECAELEKAYDAMDMNAAIYVAKKNTIMLQIEKLKLEIFKSIASGDGIDSPYVKACNQKIEKLSYELVDLSREFEQSSGFYKNMIDDCTENLHNVSNIAKDLEKQSAGFSNKYDKCLVYSEDGILRGTEAQGKISDRQFEENDVFDQRGVMVFDEADVIQRTKTININGIVVTCVADFKENTTDNTYYVGSDYDTNVSVSSQGAVEENPDVEEEIQKTNTGKVSSLDAYEYDDYEISYLLNNCPIKLSQVPLEQRLIVGSALVTMGYDRDNGKMKTMSLTAPIIAMALKQTLEQTDDLGEVPFNKNNIKY